jgi:hypothetical protein
MIREVDGGLICNQAFIWRCGWKTRKIIQDGGQHGQHSNPMHPIYKSTVSEPGYNPNLVLYAS